MKLNKNMSFCLLSSADIIVHSFFYRDEYLFNFDNTFEIHDDIEVLKRMGMAFGLEKGLCSETDLQKCIRTVPKALEPYVFGKLAFINYR
jgi:hypothetical protein